MANSSCFLKKLRDSKEANVFPLTAAAVFVLAGLVGGGVDISRAYMVQNRLQNACDSGVLAGRREVTDSGWTTEAQNAANNYFNVNFQAEPGTSGTTFAPTTPNNGDTVNGEATTTLNTTIMKLFGFEEIPLSVACTATMSVGNSDVVMVLDTTGSMAFDMPDDPATAEDESETTRIEALQDAMKSFRTVLADATSGSNSRVRYGFVPYAHTVNVGHLLDASWLVNTHSIQSREAQFKEIETIVGYEAPVTTTSTSNSGISSSWWYYHNGGFANSATCLANLPADTEWVDDGAPTTTTSEVIDANGDRITTTVTTQGQTRTDYACGRYFSSTWYGWRRTQTQGETTTVTTTEKAIVEVEVSDEFEGWEYKQVEYDVSSFKLGNATAFTNGSDGASVDYTWNGCIEERDTVVSDSISYTAGFGVSPTGMNDLDIDSAPTSDATRWKPQIPELAYYRTRWYWNGWWWQQLVSDDDVTTIGAKSQTGCPVQAQLLAQMDEDDFNDYADSLTTDGGTYHSIGMIWGARLASPDGLFADNVNEEATNEAQVARHIIFMTDGELDTGETLYSSWGVERYDQRVTSDGSQTQSNARHRQRFLAACEAAKAKGIRVWVVAFSTLLTEDMKTCASQDSDFGAETASELNTAFQEIARDVGELRVTQ